MDINIVNILLIVFLSFFSVVVHEVFHSITAYALGDDTAKSLGRMSFNPLKHIDPVMTIIFPIFMALSGGPIFGGAKPVPVNSNKLKFGDIGMALVALSGPVANFILAFFVYGLLHVVSFDGSFQRVLVILAQINLGFFVFNLLPIPPLDGSRVLYAVAPSSIQGLMREIERYGVLIVFSLIFIFNNHFGRYMSNAIYFLLKIFKVIFNK